MQVTKHFEATKDPMPLLAALPYLVVLEDGERLYEEPSYDPISQRVVYAAGRDYSTCREDDSRLDGPMISKSDTRRDD